MANESTLPDEAIASFNVEGLPKIEVGPGCYRTDLPSGSVVRAWIVDIEAGCQWPHVDHHDELGEVAFVVSGELIEGHVRYAEGCYLRYGPNSSHRPRSERGVRLFGFNTIATDEAP